MKIIGKNALLLVEKCTLLLKSVANEIFYIALSLYLYENCSIKKRFGNVQKFLENL
jgi:hypothetical protein